jgi:acid phosphatase (class A)
LKNLKTYEEWSIDAVPGTDWSFLPEVVGSSLRPNFASELPPTGRLTVEADEIDLVIKANRSKTPEDVEFARKADKPHRLFSELLSNENPDKSWIKSLWKHERNKSITKELKSRIGRPRPYWLDGRVRPIPGLESSDYSFPSGHSAGAYYMASILADRYPNRKEELFSLADRIAQSRVIAGVHYPSDIEAGKRVGLAYVELDKF